MQMTQDRKTRTYSFDSFQDFLTAATDVNQAPKAQQMSRRQHDDRYYSESFYGTGPGTQSWDDALDVARKGWEDGRRKIERISAAFASLLARVKKPEIVYDVCGDSIDMGRFMVGEPECFMTFTESEADVVGPKLVRVVLNGSASSGVSTKVLMLRGCAIAAVIQAIELSGRRCEVTVAFGMENYSSDKLEMLVKAKEFGQPLQLDQLAFVLAHPSMLRRLVFSFMETMNEADRSRYGVTSGGYGSPSEATDKGDIYMREASWADSHWQSEASAKSWVIQLLGTQNITLTPDEN